LDRTPGEPELERSSIGVVTVDDHAAFVAASAT
jgi:hypothetical protein